MSRSIMPGEVERDADRRQKKTITNQSGEPPSIHALLVASHNRTSSSAPRLSAYNPSTLRPGIPPANRMGQHQVFVQVDCSLGHLW